MVSLFVCANLAARFLALCFAFLSPLKFRPGFLVFPAWLCLVLVCFGLFGGIPLRLGAWDFLAVVCFSVFPFSEGFGDNRGQGDDTRGAMGGGDDLWCWWWRRRPFCMDFASPVWSVRCVVPPFLVSGQS